ncbi:MAG: CHASE3 domain-containing protein [Comamonadaceae bacterium]|nr:CHASE3 domain-containing protein [Comamonadaceae bacterium]
MRLALMVAALCALAMGFINEGTHRRTNEVMAEIQNAHHLRSTINSLARALSEAESGQRGFIMTGDRRYLAPYDAALNEIARMKRVLDAQQTGMVVSVDKIMSFRNFMSQKMAEMALTIRMREDNRPEVVDFVITSNIGLEQMAAFRTQSDALLADADKFVSDRRVELKRLLSFSRFGLALGVLAAFVAFFLHVRQTRALHRQAEAHQRALEAERDALETQVRERTKRLGELATHLQQAVEEERAHLARELHDELGALLTAAKLDVARLKSRIPKDATDLTERLQHLTETLNQGIALKRRIIEDLRPSSLSNLGLVASLEILAREFSERSGIPIETVLEPVDLDPASELTIYRTVQEALTNIGKYAEAQHIRVSLKNYVYHAEVSITDDGRGFDPKVLPQTSHGLVGMRHRVEGGGGRLDINSSPGRGTRIIGTVPRQHARDQEDLAVASNAMSVNSYAAEAQRPTPDSAPG